MGRQEATMSESKDVVEGLARARIAYLTARGSPVEEGYRAAIRAYRRALRESSGKEGK
jgi:hypothetical protein